MIFGDPGAGQPGLLERLPERGLPIGIGGGVEGLRVAKIGEDARCRIADDGVGIAQDDILPRCTQVAKSVFA
jgi:hypothetical protein